MTRPIPKLLTTGIAAVLTLLAMSAAAQNSQDLPDIGSPFGAMVTQDDEYEYGAAVVRDIRNQGLVLDDPEVAEYLQGIGSRISSQATTEATHHFEYIPFRDAGINAFALPGGFIMVNYGTILASSNESELAAVMAHETAHVAQRHIAREVQAQTAQSITSAAAILAAIVIGALGGGQAIEGALAAAQGFSVQQQINFTRQQEYEADRVGMGFLAAAGFNPEAMADFFEALTRHEGLSASYVPEMLVDHPVNSNRIAEARGRAAQLPHHRNIDSMGFLLIRERLKVITAAPGTDVSQDYAKLAKNHELTFAERYGDALALTAVGRGADAVKILEPMVANNQGLTLLHVALAQAQMVSGQPEAALGTFARAVELFPRNVPVCVRYAEALLAVNRPREAHEVLLDLFNNVAPTPEQIRLIAVAADHAGDNGDAYFYMGEYHIANGELQLAVQQLTLALNTPNLTGVQKQRFQARLAEIRDVLATARMQKTSSR